MAKYSKKAQQKVERAMHEMKKGKLTSGKNGPKVKDPKQAIAIGLSEAREAGAKTPRKKTAKKPIAGVKKAAGKKSATKKASVKKASKKKSPGRPRKVGRPKKQA